MKPYLKALGKFFAIILCIVIFALQVATYLSYGSKRILKEKSIKNIVDNVNGEKLISSKDKAVNNIYMSLTKAFNNTGLSEESINNVIKSTGFKNIMTGIISNYANYYITYEEDHLLITSEMQKLVDDNIDNMIASSSINVNSELRKNLIEAITNNLMHIFDDYALIIENDNPYSLELWIFQLSIIPIAKFVLILSIILLVALIALVRWNIIKSVRDSGIITIITGTLIFVISLFAYTSFDIVFNGISKFKDYVFLILPVIKEICLTFIIYSAIGIILGMIQLFIFKLLNERKKKKKALKNIVIEEE